MDPQDSLFDMNNPGQIGLSHHDDVINRAHTFLNITQQHENGNDPVFLAENTNNIWIKDHISRSHKFNQFEQNDSEFLSQDMNRHDNISVLFGDNAHDRRNSFDQSYREPCDNSIGDVDYFQSVELHESKLTHQINQEINLLIWQPSSSLIIFITS